MTHSTLYYTGELVVVTCWCGITHAVPKSLRQEQLRQHETGIEKTVLCPLGHQHCPVGESRAAKLERQLQQERQKHDQTKAALEHTENRRRAEKAAKTRVKNRVKHGVCPCCNRTFQNLARHMETQHPDYDAQKDEE